MSMIVTKYDRCLANFAVKAGLGLCAGIGMSFVLFRRTYFRLSIHVTAAAVSLMFLSNL